MKPTMFLKAILALSLLITGYRAVQLAKNYISARRLGLPIIIVPANWQDPLWVVIAPLFSFLRHVPGFSWYQYSYLGYHMHVRHAPFTKVGAKAFAIVSPGVLEIVTCDGSVCAEIGGRYKKWDKPLNLYNLFAFFGPNSLSMNGEDWLRHRRIVNHGLARNDLVRVGAAKQVREWLDTIQAGEKKTLKELEEDMDAISSNVINFVGFGQDNPFKFDENQLKQVPEGHKQSFAEAMHFMAAEFIFAWVFMKVQLPKWCHFEKFRQLRAASTELRQYFSEIVQRRDGEVVRALVEANEKEKAIGQGGSLSMDELFGNMYLLQLAGFETTSSVMLFSLCLLAIHPEVQEWARGSNERCNAVMHETLRIYGSVPVLTRCSPRDETVIVAGKELVIPANTYISGNLQAYHHDADVWGPDVAVWKPERWVETVDGQEKLKKQPETMAWSAGPRGCPGMKFSQIEFSEVIRTVIDQYEVKGSAGIRKALDNFDIKVGPKVRDPTSASIEFTKRNT